MRDTGHRRTARNAVALGASAVVHLLALLALLLQGAPEYALPTPPEAPPLQVEIYNSLEVVRPPPPPPTPRPTLPRPVAAVPTPRVPQPTPTQPVTAPSPAPPRPMVVKPVLAAPKAAPAPIVAKPAPSETLSATPLPSLAPEPAPKPPAPTPPAPARPPVAAAPATSPGPTAPRLNIHKSEKDAPAGTPTLPMAPSTSPPPSGGRPAGGGEPLGGGGGSRLQGLVPYPPGSLPNGGAGLRGSLVGCANAQAVGLSSVERAHCEQRFGASAATAPHLDGIPPEKRSAYDRDVARSERDRAYRNASTSSALTGMGGVPADQTTTVIKLPQ